jgi:putative ABC transport system permease protein
MSATQLSSAMRDRLEDVARRLGLVRAGHVALAWRNATSNRRRLARAALGIGFATLLIFMQLGFRAAFLESSLMLIRAFDADLVIKKATNYQFGQREPFPRLRMHQALSVAGVASVSPVLLEWHDSRWKNPDTGKTYIIRVVGFDPDKPTLMLPAIERALPALRQQNTVVMDSRARRHVGGAVTGLMTELAGRQVTVVGTVPLGPDFFIDGTLFMSERNFLTFFADPNAPGDRYNEVDFGLIKIKSGFSADIVRRSLQDMLPRDVVVITKDELLDQESAFQASVSPVGTIFGLGAVIGFGVGILIAYQILFTEISDRLSQYATLKAIGYGRGFLLGVIARQSLIYGIAGFGAAFIAAQFLYLVIDWAILLPMHMSYGLFLVTLLMTTAMCLIAGFTAGRKAVAADPAEVF